MLERLDGIRQDIALIGVPAVISLLEALIRDDNHLYREDLVRNAALLCRFDMLDTIEDLVDHFEGTDPRRHMWTKGANGFYRPLEGPFRDFPN
jgi:hypothetical protein